MNILLFPYNAYSPTEGGIARITYTLINEFRAQGHFVLKVGHKKNEHSVVEDNYQFFLPSRITILCQANIRFFCDLCDKYDIDIVFLQNDILNLVELIEEVKKRKQVKAISCIHNSVLTPVYNFAYTREYELKKRGMAYLFRLLKTSIVKNFLVYSYIRKYRKQYRDVVNHSDAVVVLCEGQVQELKRMYGKTTLDNVYVIPNCIDSIYEPQVKKRKDVLWVGAFDTSIKRPDLMLQIWQKLLNVYPEWHLYMLGDGYAFDEMKRLSENMQMERITFTGRVNPSEYYSMAKILCVTSTHEAFPMVTLEAMCYGLATVAFNSFTSAPVLIEDKQTGFLVTPFKVDEYAETLSAIMRNDQLQSLLSEASRRKAEEFSITVVYKKWENLFNKLVNKD